MGGGRLEGAREGTEGSGQPLGLVLVSGAEVSQLWEVVPPLAGRPGQEPQWKRLKFFDRDVGRLTNCSSHSAARPAAYDSWSKVMWTFLLVAAIAFPSLSFIGWLIFCRWCARCLPPDIARTTMKSAGRYFPLRPGHCAAGRNEGCRRSPEST